MLAAVTHLVGVIAFVYPFFLGNAGGGRGAAHAADAPYLFAALGVLVLAVALAEVRAGRMDAKQVAMLGVLAGINAVLRLPGSFAGASLMFVLPILVGAAFGARAGFLLGTASMAASAVITGGVGPWLPFQMWALGWIGMSGAIARPLVDRARIGTAVVVLVFVAWVGGHAFGVLVNLWFWPFQAGASDLAWEPGLSGGEAFARYRAFYLLTSLGWDATRAIANAALIAIFGPAVLRLLSRYRARVTVTWLDPQPAASPIPTPVA